MPIAQPARERQAVLARHVDVEQRQRRRLFAHQRARVRGVGRGIDSKTVAAQVLGDHLAQVRLVVDKEESGHELRFRVMNADGLFEPSHSRHRDD